MMSTIVISIPNGDDQVNGISPPPKKSQRSFLAVFSFLEKQTRNCNIDTRKLTHSIKVGVALVLVSLLYILDPLYQQVGDNAMWAIMTVVVMFEFFAGATISKGLNRCIGTILGGGFGCSAAFVAQELGGIGNSVAVGISVFVFGAAATYSRLVPSIKRRYDYGAMIFILTFNLVVVSGLRAEKVMELARERLTTIAMGFSVCIFTSFLIFPMWASDELHNSTASKFEKLASSIERCLDEYFKLVGEKETRPCASFSCCKSVLNSKTPDETLANFAKWEPWHGKFGFSHPWDKYLQIGEILRELAATILSLRGCLQSSKQPLPTLRQTIKEPCESIGSTLAWTLRELEESIKKMRRCRPRALVESKMQAVRVELSLITAPSNVVALENCDGLAIANLVFLLTEVVEKVEVLAKEVEELGELAGFQTK